MSFTAVESLRLLKKAEVERQKRLDKEIDVDVQKLREKADDHMITGKMDSKGYYVLCVQRTDIKYKDPKVVIDRFCAHMESLGFIVPEVNQKNGWFGQSHNYIVRFRPNDEALAQVNNESESEEEDSDDDDDEEVDIAARK